MIFVKNESFIWHTLTCSGFFFFLTNSSRLGMVPPSQPMFQFKDVLYKQHLYSRGKNVQHKTTPTTTMNQSRIRHSITYIRRHRSSSSQDRQPTILKANQFYDEIEHPRQVISSLASLQEPHISQNIINYIHNILINSIHILSRDVIYNRTCNFIY
jgi:hypothetical protein